MIDTYLESLGQRFQRHADRAAWLAFRAAGHRVGGTDATTLAGVGYEPLWSLWERHHGQTPATSADKAELFAEGHLWEPVILDLYAEHTGSEVRGMDGTTIADADDPWGYASLDALACDHGEVGAVDAKTNRKIDSRDMQNAIIAQWNDTAALCIPEVYAVQGYHYLDCTGLPWIDFAILCAPAWWLGPSSRVLRIGERHPDDPFVQAEVAAVRREAGKRLRIVRIMRDDGTQAALRGTVRDLRQHHIIDGEPPEIDHSDACRRHVGRPTGEGVQRATDDQDIAARRLRSERRMAAASATTAKRIRHGLVGSMTGRKLVGDGWSITKSANGRITLKGL